MEQIRDVAAARSGSSTKSMLPARRGRTALEEISHNVRPSSIGEGEDGTLRAVKKKKSLSGSKPTMRERRPLAQRESSQQKPEVVQSVEDLVTKPSSSSSQPDSAQVRESMGLSSLSLEEETSLAEIDPVDRDVASNPLYFVPYIPNIMDFYFETEGQYMPQRNYMDKQPDINRRMRAILVDWLVEVHFKFGLKPETLYLTVHIVDRFLEKKQVSKSKLQLVGCTAMLIASKYEEIFAPEIRDFVYISDSAYTREDIIEMEIEMCDALDYELTVPTAYHFVKRFFRAAGADAESQRVRNLAFYMMELTFSKYHMLQFKPSMIAASALYLAIKLVHHKRWSDDLIRNSTYRSQELRPCVNEIYAILVETNSRERAVRKKYASSKFGKVACLRVTNN
ncbi:MAG: hypothetical protein MHM6MM_002100 [Cercozoa sp. M6MM]